MYSKCYFITVYILIKRYFIKNELNKRKERFLLHIEEIVLE